MNEILSAMLQSVLSYLLPVLAVALTGFLVAKIKEAWARAKVWNPDVTELLENAAKFAVTAAEQAGAAKLIDDKKTYAFEVAEEWLGLHGVIIDIDMIDAAIEAAVYKQFKQPNDGD